VTTRPCDSASANQGFKGRDAGLVTRQVGDSGGSVTSTRAKSVPQSREPSAVAVTPTTNGSKSKVPTVLHVTEAASGGVRRLIVDLSSRQAALGWRVVVASPPDTLMCSWLAQANVHHMAWPARLQPHPSVILELVRLRHILTSVQPDIVHLHHFKAGLLGRALLHGRRPVVYQPHSWVFVALDGIRGRLALVWERWADRWTNAYVCVGEDERDSGVTAGVRGLMTIVRLGVDLEQFPYSDDRARRDSRERLNLTARPLVVCLARLHRQKNQHLLLDAWPAVRAIVPNAVLALVGDGPDEMALRARAIPGVLFAGPTTDPGSWFAAADVVVQPSMWEGGISCALVEALATGRSVIVADSPGLRDLPCCFPRVRPDDATGLAAAVVKRLSDRELAEAEGLAARRLVERRHNEGVVFGQLMQVYDDVLAASGAGVR
jgi:glycosyltransferase involved in cell wall biosynthesis